MSQPQPVGFDPADPDRPDIEDLLDAAQYGSREPEPPGSPVAPLSLMLEVFTDGQDYPVISAVRLPDEPGWVLSRFVVIRQMTDVPDRYVVQLVHPDPDTATGWCCERTRYRVNYPAALAILADQVEGAL